MSDGEMIDISKIKPGDMVTVGPFEVVHISRRQQIQAIDAVGSFVFFTPAQILTHTPAPREIKVGDRVKRKDGSIAFGEVISVRPDGDIYVIWCGRRIAYPAYSSDLTIVEDGE